MSLPFCIDAGLTGAEFCLFDDGNGRVAWLEEPPDDCLVLALEERNKLCLKTVFALENQEINVRVPTKYEKSMSQTLRDSFSYESVPWRHVLPQSEYKLFLTSLVQNVRRAVKGLDTRYYRETFSRVTPLFRMLDYAAIDVPRLERYLLDPKTVNPQTLQTFQPIAGTFARAARYDRFATRTGRLTVKTGPNILTLKREYRDVVTTCHVGGKVRYVDYSSLEARVLLTVAGQKVETKDVYTEIGKKLLPTKPRNVVKLIVIATVYGSEHQNLQRLSKLSEKKMLEVMNHVKEMFAVEELQKRLHDEWRANNGHIRNFYGRIVVVPDESTLINSFVQSTAVDVTLLGFHQLVCKMKELGLRSRAVFLLHDAIIIDTHPNEEEGIDHAIEAATVIPGMNNLFFLDKSDFSCT